MNLNAGDKLSVPTLGGLVDLPVVGVFATQSGDQVLVPLQTAQRMFDATGQITGVDVIITAGADRDAVKKALLDELGPTFSVGSAAANQYQAKLTPSAYRHADSAGAERPICIALMS